jgi:hypothetical protein
VEIDTVENPDIAHYVDRRRETDGAEYRIATHAIIEDERQ